jgi:hypothetical protein
MVDAGVAGCANACVPGPIITPGPMTTMRLFILP